MSPPKILLDTGPSGPKTLHRHVDWLKCKRVYAYRWVEGRQERVKPALVRGSYVHTGLAHHAARLCATSLGHDPERFWSPLAAIELQREEERPQWGDFVDAQFAIASKVVSAVTERRGTLDVDEWEVLYVEDVFTIPVLDEETGIWHTYTQKPDCILRNRYTGLIYIVDWKTHNGHDLKKAIVGYTTAIQFLSYQWWGPQFFKEQFGGVFVHLISLQEDRGFEHHRDLVPPAPALVRYFPKLYVKNEKEMLAYRERGEDKAQSYPPAAHEEICISRYGKCDAWEPCTTGEEHLKLQPQLVNVNVSGLRTIKKDDKDWVVR